MEKYIGVKAINAVPMSRLAYNDFRGWKLPANEDGADAGYLVEYVDGGEANTAGYKGYVSWSPKDVFERAYRSVKGMTFGFAIEAMKQGKKVSRAGWNGKGMYLWLMPEAMVKAEWCKEPHLKELASGNGGEILALGTIRMYTHDRSGRNAILTGWLASQSDMLSEDWMIVE